MKKYKPLPKSRLPITITSNPIHAQKLLNNQSKRPESTIITPITKKRKTSLSGRLSRKLGIKRKRTHNVLSANNITRYGIAAEVLKKNTYNEDFVKQLLPPDKLAQYETYKKQLQGSNSHNIIKKLNDLRKSLVSEELGKLSTNSTTHKKFLNALKYNSLDNHNAKKQKIIEDYSHKMATGLNSKVVYVMSSTVEDLKEKTRIENLIASIKKQNTNPHTNPHNNKLLSQYQQQLDRHMKNVVNRSVLPTAQRTYSV